MYAAVLFDLDNTLIDREAAFRALVQATFPTANAQDELICLDQGGYGDRTRFLNRWRALGGSEFDAKRFGLAVARFVKPQRALLDALSDLSERTKLAIVTNGGIGSQEAKWRAAGLPTIIPRNRLWISEEVGSSKPDPTIFIHACRWLHVAASSCLYVGDQLQIDIVGARAAGLSTLLATSPLTAERISRLCCSANPHVETAL